MSCLPSKRSFASREQFSYLVDFMYDNPKFSCSGRARSSYGKIERDRMWIEVAEVLNSLAGGVKTAEQWRTGWSELKKRARSKLRAMKNQRTSGKSSTSYQYPITELEKCVIAIVHRDYNECNGWKRDLIHNARYRNARSSIAANTSDKGQRIKGNDFTHQAVFLEIISKQADTLNTLVESNTTNAELAKHQADTLRIIAECSTASIEMMKSTSESIKSINENLKANADALNYLADVINSM